VKISKSTHDTKLVRDRVRANLNSMMYSETPEAFDLAHQLFITENKEFEVFLAYFNSLWLPRKGLWSKAWRHVIIHAYCFNSLKSKFSVYM
jgi:hypothetical protein